MGLIPGQGNFLVTRLSCHSRWICSDPVVLRLFHQESPFSHLEAVAFPPTFRMRRTAVLLLRRLLGAADKNGCSVPGSHPQIILLRVEVPALSKLASRYRLLTTEG